MFWYDTLHYFGLINLVNTLSNNGLVPWLDTLEYDRLINISNSLQSNGLMILINSFFYLGIIFF